jgi:hypothetical protein
MTGTLEEAREKEQKSVSEGASRSAEKTSVEAA